MASVKLSGARIGDQVTIIDKDGSEARGRVVKVWPDHCGLICSETHRRLKATDSNTLRIEHRDATADEAREKGSISVGTPAVLMPRSHQRRRYRCERS
jgi:putative aminopeptidase FrvX